MEMGSFDVKVLGVVVGCFGFRQKVKSAPTHYENVPKISDWSRVLHGFTLLRYLLEGFGHLLRQFLMQHLLERCDHHNFEIVVYLK